MRVYRANETPKTVSVARRIPDKISREFMAIGPATEKA